MDCIHTAFLHAFPALDTFHIPNIPNIHPAGAHAPAAVGTGAFIYPYPQHCHRGKKGIDCPKRAEETAEASVNKTCADEDDSHHKHFPGKQRPCKAAQRFVQEHQRYTAFQGSCGTYVFAERRHRKPCGHLKYNGEQDYKYNQYHVLQFG